ncbi:MAG: dockerin type I domain-containing protein, partial [Phycisphaerales bacterium]|nr:dockerin type I domain-containing protein [Phycisphaerales bacterium]
YDGDVNGDSRIDGRDIQGFMGMLLDGGAVVTDIPLFVEAVLHPADSDDCTGDMNGDGTIDGRDIQGFVEKLAGE